MSDLLPLLRTLGALGTVLGLLGAALWAVRRFDIALPGRVGVRALDKRLAVVERVQLDQRRALMLVRRDDREHLFVLLPDRIAVLESDIAPAPAPNTTAPAFADIILCPSLDGDWYRG